MHAARLSILIAALCLSIPSVSVGDGAASAVTHFLPGIDVRCLAQDAAGAIWIGLDDGLAVLRPDATEPTRLDLEALAGISINTILPDEDCLWLGTDEGLFRYADGQAELIDMVGASAQDWVPSDARPHFAMLEFNEPVRALCMAEDSLAGDALWLGTDAAIMQYGMAHQNWGVFRKSGQWGMMLEGEPARHVRPVVGCKRLLRDATGRRWALTASGLSALRAPGAGQPVSWESGYVSDGDGNDEMYVGFWQVSALTNAAMQEWLGEYYGVPADIALDATGSLRVLAADGAILTPPQPPNGIGRITFGTYREFTRIMPSGTDALQTARILAFTDDAVIVAGESTDGLPILCISSADLKTSRAVISLAEKAAAPRDLLVAADSRILVGTDRGLFEMRLP